jgi:Family of unknown function (DUF6492)
MDAHLSEAFSTEEPDRSIVTPTYLPDLRQCELLAESLDRNTPGVPHYLIVDRRDRTAFSHLERGMRRLVESEALVGSWMRRMPGRKSFWLSLKAPPVRGWIVQQILKIASVDEISQRTLVFCDSDVAFLRPFGLDHLLVDGKIGLADVEYWNDEIVRWTKVARRLLGLSPRDDGYHNHVGNMICWNREIVFALRERIEKSTGTKWQVALARTPTFSEYILYGVFVREVLGYDAVDHAPSSAPLVKASWGTVLKTDSDIDAFFSDFDPSAVAVMVHSKDGVDPARFRRHIERHWRAVKASGSGTVTAQ